MERLSDDNLTLADQLLTELTPGDYAFGHSETQTHEDAVAWVERSIRFSEVTDMWGVFTTQDDGPDCLILAVTGNGPNAERNARSICNLLRMAPYLLAEVRELRAIETAMLDHLPECHRATGYYALENDCSCGLYARRQVINAIGQDTA